MFLAFKENCCDIEYLLIEADEKHLAVDPTGCGDVFSAAFVIKYYQSFDPVESAIYASKIASKNAQHKGIEWLKGSRQ